MGGYYAVDPEAPEKLEKQRLAGALLLGAFHVPGQARARRSDGQGLRATEPMVLPPTEN